MSMHALMQLANTSSLHCHHEVNVLVSCPLICMKSGNHCVCSTPITSATHGDERDPWHSLATALDATRHELLLWEKVGRVAHISKLPGYQTQDKPQPLLVSAQCILQLCCVRHLHSAVCTIPSSRTFVLVAMLNTACLHLRYGRCLWQASPV